MGTRDISVRGRTVHLFEAGDGLPLVYLHGIADLHGVTTHPQPFHEALAGSVRLIAPAHPGCAGSAEDETLESIEDLVFHLLEVLDVLGISRFDVLGTCIGGWLAAELAVRHPERVGRLVLIGASGLFVEGQPISDLFMMAQAENGSIRPLRAMLFNDPDSEAAESLFADEIADVESGLLRYKAFRFASRIGFKPPYFYHRKLIDRLHRYGGPALVLWGEHDRMVPVAHAEAYLNGLRGGRLEFIAGCGHSPHIEAPAKTADSVLRFLKA